MVVAVVAATNLIVKSREMQASPSVLVSQLEKVLVLDWRQMAKELGDQYHTVGYGVVQGRGAMLVLGIERHVLFYKLVDRLLDRVVVSK